MFNNFLLSLLFAILPKTRCHRIKRIAMNLCGHNVEIGAKVNGDIRIYGRGVLNIGEGTWVGLHCVFVTHPDAPISIGKNCDIGPMVAFVTGSHELGCFDRRAGIGLAKAISVGDGTWVGARSSLLAGANVGAASVVGAGSLVRESDYPVSVLLAGVPAVIKRHFEPHSHD